VGTASGADDRPPDLRPVGRPPGRPRDASRTHVILNATTEIITEVGFERLRVQDVAERAGASLATIYRRWPTKTALVVDAIRLDPGPLPELGELGAAQGVDGVLRTIATMLQSSRGARMAVLAVQLDEPEILRAVRETHVTRIRAVVREALEQVLGADTPDLDLLSDLGPALVWYRALVVGEDDDPAELASRIGALLRP
jgi:AcrR family transcriptional regulator